MTDPLPPAPADDNDPLVRRIIDSARAYDREIVAPSLAAAQNDLAQRIAARGESGNAQPFRAPCATPLGLPSGFSRVTAPHTLGRSRSRWVLTGGLIAGGVIAWIVGAHTTPQSPTITRNYATATGQQAVVSLDDGTRVTLAPRTTLRLIDFGARARTVLLDGQAYFEVSRQSSVPFVVRAGTVRTRVLGTTFGVRHYTDDPTVRVVVKDGKVVVNAGVTPLRDVVVTAGYVGDATDSTVRVQTVERMDTELGWINDELVFNDKPVSEVLNTLTRWYGYGFRTGDPTLLQRHVTIGVSTRSSTKALATLRRVLNVNLAASGDTITLTPLRGPAKAGPHPEKSYDVFSPTREVGR